jgi:molybdopterin synthase sulfur carrier subunit
MNQIKVRYFAAFREATGIETERLESRFDGLQNYSAAMVAINDEMSDWNAALNDGDEVLFFPPVAGG